MVAFRNYALLRIWRRADMELDTGVKEVLDHHYPSTLESVDLAEGEILTTAEEAGFDEDDRHRIGMAVRECMVNAVVHGNRYNRNKRVHVKVYTEKMEPPASENPNVRL